MKQFYSAKDLVEAQMLKDFISDQHIEVMLKGDLLMGAVGEIPADTAPSLWVINDDDYDTAKELVATFANQASLTSNNASVWKCLACNELMEPQFSQCWNCGGSRPQT